MPGDIHRKELKKELKLFEFLFEFLEENLSSLHKIKNGDGM